MKTAEDHQTALTPATPVGISCEPYGAATEHSNEFLNETAVSVLVRK
jgi:hypothetical protein